MRFAILMCAALAAACSGSSSSPSPSQPTAVLQLTATPPTIPPAVCPPNHCGPLLGQLEIEGTITVRETSGVAVTITRFMLTIRRRSDNVAIASNDVVAASAPIRVAASGSTPVPIAMHFDASAAESTMKIVVAIDGTDANGHAITASTEFEIR